MISHAAERGNMGMIVVAHNIQHIFQVCTRMIVLRQGRLVADVKADETDPEEIVAFITGAK